MHYISFNVEVHIRISIKMNVQSIIVIFLIGFVEIGLCAIGDLATAKCKEFSKYVYQLTTDGEIDEDAPSECGISEVPLVIGGEEASEMEFPHMAALGYADEPTDKMEYSCGGTLISELYILTAAHCMALRGIVPCQKAKLGGINLGIPDEDIVVKNVAARIPHPQHKPPAKYHDIALLRLDSPVQFNGFIRPACLMTKPIDTEEKAIASGWGKTAFANEKGSLVLMKVVLDLIPNANCSIYYSSAKERRFLANGIDDSLLCAGKLEGGKDTCQGDSGGPLTIVMSEPYCMYQILGVVSFGKFCGFANSPGVYTRIHHYLDWIEKNVWSHSFS